MTVVENLSRAHAARGGRSLVVLSDNRGVRIDGVENVFVDYTRYCPRQRFTRWQWVKDLAAGFIGMVRPTYSKLFLPAIEAAAEIQPDIILVHEAHYAAVSLPLWRKFCPDALIILYVHVGLSRSYGRRELRRLFGDADGIICVSSDARHAVVSRAPWAAGRIFTVENGVDTDLFRPASANGEGGPFEVLFVGRVTPAKGPDRLLRALEQARRRTDVALSARIVGSAHFRGGSLTRYEEELRDEVRSQQLDVEFVPFVPHGDLPAVYNRSSVVAVPSVFRDPFALVVLEAMACGRPVVASSRGGVPEAGGDAARYFDPDDIDGFADILVRLAEDPDERRRMAADSLARARANSWSVRYDSLMEVVDRLR
jgi:glycosyltransferase involved in cell wall biosynthesis